MKAPMPRRVLIANRGEIALRVARTCRAHGVEVVTVHSSHDARAPHVAVGRATQAVPSYLDAAALVDAARATGCDAVHPGYGFLSENAAFARAVQDAGLTWIGPPPAAMEIMGTKTTARAAMEKAGVPVVPGAPAGTPDELLVHARRIGFPVLVKAAGGGGGKGMMRVDREEDFLRLARAASDEAARSFADPSVYLERIIERPRHVEIQVFADRHGAVVSLGERECSIQRRHQKIVEESPSPAVDESLRARMGEAAVEAARAVRYEGAGTVEFLLGGDGRFHFLEMNTRLQVEHPVTEWVTGLDLVRLQLEVAAGAALPPEVLAPVRRGHALECRLYAEDPAQGHLPQAGPLLLVREPFGPGIRVDSALVEGGEVTIHYDPMLAKLSTFGADREEARLRMLEALSRFVVLGVRTNVDYLQDVIAHPAFVRGELTTGFLDEHLPSWPDTALRPPDPALAATGLPVSRAGSTASGAARAARPDPWALLPGYRSLAAGDVS